MKINTAIILCAGYGKRLNPLTFKTPKPLLKLNDKTVLENCINLIIKLKIKKIFLNTFYLSDQIFDFVEKKKFPIDIQVIDDGKKILDTGGGIHNLMKSSDQNDFIVFNPDTIWSTKYYEEILKMEEIYFSNKIENILLLVNKNLSFDKNLKGDFNLENNLITKTDKKFIYIGCQIINKKLFDRNIVEKFSILDIWNNLINNKKLYGYESQNDFYHLTDLHTFKKLKDFLTF